MKLRPSFFYFLSALLFGAAIAYAQTNPVRLTGGSVLTAQDIINACGPPSSGQLLYNNSGVCSGTSTLPSGLTISALTVINSFTATGLVTNADLVNPATTVNGQTCTLGSTCTAPAAAGTLTGTTLATNVVTSSLTAVGTLTTGGTGTGFTLALGTSTVTGVLPAANGGAGSVNGALKANGSGTVSQAGFGDLTGSLAQSQVPTGGTNLQFLQTNGSGTGSWASTRQIIPMSSAATALPQNTTAYILIGLATTEAAIQGLCPFGGTFKNLYLVSTAPATGQTLTATWRINNATPSNQITCTITGPATTCNDTTHTSACTAGQSYDLLVVSSASTGSITTIGGGIEFDNP